MAVPRPSPDPRIPVRSVPDWHRPLVAVTLLCAVVLGLSLAGLTLDDRLVTGEPVWLKPAKFALSIAVYNVTLAWLLSLLTRWRRTGWWLGTIAAAMVAGELLAIVLQAVRGEPSHFNYTTPFDTAVYYAMAVMIVTVWTANLGVGAIVLAQRLGDRATTWAIRIGTAISLVGMALAFLMTFPTAQQMATLGEGGEAGVLGAHTVGLPDGGPGLPFVGWSSVAGDLRVPHFVGLHGLQAMILLALVLLYLRRRHPRLASDLLRLRVVAVVGASYSGLVALTTWQALRGQSVARPDALTLVVAGALVAATALGLWWASRRGRPRGTDIPERATLPG
ncbi:MULTISPECIES: hypothetical protein [unclassified Nocardiopsis]|uniref:hypothetical protein n=1 Tax=unclassified Nocardiopsis TaxID=2649073 RepID=UPI00135A928F|nr:MULTISPECIES: hypothetical protein [unclassified Nocardiopsis]